LKARRVGSRIAACRDYGNCTLEQPADKIRRLNSAHCLALISVCSARAAARWSSHSEAGF